MPIIFQKGTTSQLSHTLVVGNGLSLNQTPEGLSAISTGGASGSGGEGLVYPSGSDDTTAIRNAVNANARTRLAPGVFTVSGIIDVGAGKVVCGSGIDKTTITKTNFSGPVFRLGDTTEHAAIENLRIAGPGKAVGTGNTAIMAVRSTGGLPTSRRLRFSNLHIEELSSYGFHIEKCSVLDIDSCVVRNVGFDGVFVAGATSQPRQSSSIRIANVRVSGSGGGINVRRTEGVALIACEAEACWGSFRMVDVGEGVVIGCVSKKCEQIGLLISGGANVGVESFLSDNVGTPYFANFPHLKVEAVALGVRVNGFRRLNTDQAGTLTWEADVAAAGGRVLVGYHDFTGGKINSAGKFADVSATVVP